MICIHETDRDVFVFCGSRNTVHYVKMVHLCFTRLVIGLHPSLAILGAIIEHHLSRYQEIQPDLVKKVENSF